MGYLYITDNAATIGIHENYVCVTEKKEEIRKVLLETLESISIFGKAQMTTQCVQSCLSRGIPVSYYSKTGKYFGKLQSTGHSNVERQRKQDLLYNTDFALELGKKIISSKIHNQMVVLNRYSKSQKFDNSEYYSQMKILLRKVSQSNGINQLMGYEGNAARIYFKVLSMLTEPEFQFNGRRGFDDVIII